MIFTSVVYQVGVRFFRLLPFKTFWCYLLRALPINPHKFYKDVRFEGTYAVNIEGKKLLLQNSWDTTIENEIFWLGLQNGWEKISIDLWIKLAKQSKVVFDIGSNTGIYSLIAGVLNPNAEVYAFEPSSSTYSKLTKNITRNELKNVTTHNVALSDSTGSATFYDYEGGHQYSASLNKAMSNQFDSSILKPYEVSVSKLDDFIDQQGITQIDLMKIDVEMHEPEVLEGFKVYLAKFKPTLLIEILNDEIGQKVEKYLGNLGYHYYNIDELSTPTRVDSLHKSSHYNYLICSTPVALSLGLPTT
jgi:FkbM family methyltransferase